MKQCTMLPTAWLLATFVYLSSVSLVCGLRFDASLAKYNLNQNTTAVNPLDYWGERTDHDWTASPPSWRVPTYTIFLDRFANGDPTNDNLNGTVFEQDVYSNQLRHGGDLQGLVDSLDYIHGIGIKVIYIAGSIFINQPWGADSYSPLDLTLLDFHFGTLDEWRTAVDEIHKRGMHVILDHTMGTLGDLIGFEDYLNSSTPFSTAEYKAVWKSGRQYMDFSFGNEYNATCNYPQFWLETGYPVGTDVKSQLRGCYNSDFDQYGDIEAFGLHPDWQRQLAKFASVQDRLREWHPPVRARIERFTCMVIANLDIDGFRVDKGVQVTVDAQADISSAIRKCALKYNKDNFFIPGEITSGNTLGSIYLGRGRRPDQKPTSPLAALQLVYNDSSSSNNFIRDQGESALDAGAFHYSIYRFMTRFLGMSGNLEAGFDLPSDWVEAWNQILLTNDLYNVNNGKFDPRHMFGVTNQDVFRWPGISQGTERMLLAYFITTLMLPGVPLMYYGEEQALYVLDSTAENYVYGRQAMSAALAWKLHGCYTAGTAIYVDWPLDKAATGCMDDTVAYDHRDPSHPVRNIFKHMFELRTRPELQSIQDGFSLNTLAKQTSKVLLEGSTTATEFGVWSIARSMYFGVQNTTETPVWLVFHNHGEETTYTFDCSGNDAFIAPFDAGEIVTNLFSPYDVITLGKADKKSSGFSSNLSGCIGNITMAPYEYRAYVPSAKWAPPKPMITKFIPGHDTPIESDQAKGTVQIGLHFSEEMSSCDAITAAIAITSTVEGSNETAKIDSGSVKCEKLDKADALPFTGVITSGYSWTANLVGAADGVHAITVTNATSLTGSTGTTDKFLIRIGQSDNPVVFPFRANYSSTLLSQGDDGKLYVNHRAPGASKWRFSTTWGSSWSDWAPYRGGGQKVLINPQPWSGTSNQAWEGNHVMIQYWSQPLGSASFMQHADTFPMIRRFPHLTLQGPFNKWGYDNGIPNQLALTGNSTWELHYMDEWPSTFQFNVWGINPDDQPDQTWVFGDLIANGIANRLPPPRLPDNTFNITGPPPLPALSYRLVLNDATFQVDVLPQGHIWIQVLLFFLLPLLPLILGFLATWAFFRSFYRVTVNKRGFKRPSGIRAWIWPWAGLPGAKLHLAKAKDAPAEPVDGTIVSPSTIGATALSPTSPVAGGALMTGAGGQRRTVLLATMEYNIDDWNIVIRIGGLGVMAKLMSTALSHLDIIWVVPCVGDVDYPLDTPAESMFVTVLGQQYEVYVQYHKPKSPPGNNITYVLLDAPIFRQQTKADPYHARMDDIESAILYATWNACIAETMRRFPQIDLYHMNDYHGAAAPLYLLPEERTIPCCLSLHNAEFQGMWSMRTPEETREVCDVFGLSQDIVKSYVQYGSAFNLLHAGASYLRIHQHGFGAVGVSKKYGDRSLARYPIFWSLKTIGHLPNPDPTDTAEWTAPEPAHHAGGSKALAEKQKEDLEIQGDVNENRGHRAAAKQQAQEWAGLEVNADAELFIFAGRWSHQKGVDLIADVFPGILEKFPQTQLICVGPVIDLHGKFAALKLGKVADMFPGRVFYRAEFTSLPAAVFNGADFALIPSRDEPFGLVAVESGRRGALGVGARVGGLGQMPGFWYTIESTSPQHLIAQFRKAIYSALESTPEKRATMRAWGAKQRFPVVQWVQRVNELHSEAIRIHHHETERKAKRPMSLASPLSRSTFFFSSSNHALPTMKDNESGSIRGSPRPESIVPSVPPSRTSTPFMIPHIPGISALEDGTQSMESLSLAGAGAHDDEIVAPVLPFAQSSYSPNRNSSGSTISLQDVVGDRSDLKLQKVDPFFADTTGEFYARYESMLDDLTVENSQGNLCIAGFLKKSEKEWFSRYRDAKLGMPRAQSGMTFTSTPDTHSDSVAEASSGEVQVGMPNEKRRTGMVAVTDDEFLLGNEYKPPTGLRKILSIRVFRDWPVYSVLLAAGQVISANSYQIVLLTGETGQSSRKLYTVAGTYIATSLIWWFMVRRFKSVYALSLPWLLYGIAFMLLGIASFVPGYMQRGNVQDVATAFYAAAASSGALDFSLNFGDESGASTNLWAVRALVITAFAQLYSAALWYWGSLMSDPFHPTGSASGSVGTSNIPKGIVIAIPIAVLFWTIGLVLFWGLPDYYRQSPETIPGYYVSLFRRKTVLWFFVMVVLQNYWLSAPYGRSWEFLFSSRHVPGWAIFLLAVLFFVILWCALILIFTVFSNSHPWLLPIFATGLGLGAPRWAQELWGTSGIGRYLPWVGGPVASAILSRCVWLWLGLLDTIQIVGLGMTLLATLTRQHVMGVLIGSQVIGGAATMIARATSPNAVQATTTFPDFSEGILPGIASKWFWICLIMQLIIPFGFFKFFRKEQVTKP